MKSLKDNMKRAAVFNTFFSNIKTNLEILNFNSNEHLN